MWYKKAVLRKLLVDYLGEIIGNEHAIKLKEIEEASITDRQKQVVVCICFELGILVDGGVYLKNLPDGYPKAHEVYLPGTFNVFTMQDLFNVLDRVMYFDHKEWLKYLDTDGGMFKKHRSIRQNTSACKYATEMYRKTYPDACRGLFCGDQFAKACEMYCPFVAEHNGKRLRDLERVYDSLCEVILQTERDKDQIVAAGATYPAEFIAECESCLSVLAKEMAKFPVKSVVVCKPEDK